MRDSRVVLMSVVVVLATLLAGSTPAQAERRMLVLIDASGSMTTLRNNADGRGVNRFEAAQSLAAARVREQVDIAVREEEEDLKVAVFTFRGAVTAIPVTSDFVDPNLAIDAIEGLSVANGDVGGGTPLGGAICEAVNALALTTAESQILQVSSDGEENATPTGTICAGFVHREAVTDPSQYPTGSYQRNVLTHLASVNSAIIRFDLFESSQVTFAPAQAAADPEGILSPPARSRLTSPAAGAVLNPLQQFFTFVTQATGGHLTIADDARPLPVTGDLNNDSCVNRADAILVARAFGPVAPPLDGRLDLNLDRTVDIADYLLQASRIQPACGPDPFVPRAPIVCDGPKQIVIDGQAVESGAITVDVRSACQIVIKNSLIVSGQNAITINGSAVVKVDNSIIVGPNALLGTRGTVILSTANTFFRGRLSTSGALSIIDRGGNVFE